MMQIISQTICPMSWTIVHIYAILPWDIYHPCEGFPGPSFNVLDYPGLFLYN